MTFNPELIAKARKGEIAILNDGNERELYEVLSKVWPEDNCNNNAYGPHFWKYYYKASTLMGWGRDTKTSLPAHSVKEFFMNTKEPEIVWDSESFVKDDRPRTYRVTRQQMKEIWKAYADTPDLILQIAGAWFGAFDDEVNVDDVQLSDLLDCYTQPYPEILRKTFPSYFHIPEGEPVLVRQDDSMNWVVRISNGKGGAYQLGYLSGKDESWKQIIPYTKQPPK